MGQQAGQHPTDAVFDTIIREDLARFMKLVAERPEAYRKVQDDAEAIVSLMLKGAIA